jgi:hypothetical protein
VLTIVFELSIICFKRGGVEVKFTSKKVLSLPPYISTLWSNVVSLQLEYRSSGHVLVVELKTGSKVEVPNLAAKVIEELFATHVGAMQYEENAKNEEQKLGGGHGFPFTLFEGITSALQHNPNQANMPILPPEVLEKITTMFKGVVLEDLAPMPKPELHCNCMYCQIMNAVVSEGSSHSSGLDNSEEEVTEKDLQFRQWDIEQQKDKLFIVTNPFDVKEQYTVFLGDPIGCTCGEKNCEHVQTVLRS